MTSPFPHFDISVDKDNVTEGVKEILQILRPEWDFDNEVTSVRFTEGFANEMFCYHRKDDPQKNDGIIIRVNLLDLESLNMGFSRQGEVYIQKSNA